MRQIVRPLVMLAALTATVVSAQAKPAHAKPVAAKPVTDCALRDAPFSANTPLIDLLLSPAAKAVLDKYAPGRLSKMPPQFAGTNPPTFAAILSLRQGALITGLNKEQIAAADAELRTLPVTAADKLARCARYDNDVPSFSLPKGKKTVLMFEKINGFKDVPSFNAAHAAFLAMAERKGFTIVSTDKGGVFNAKSLKQFDAVIWNNISGDVLTLSQRKAFQDYLVGGGAFIGVHGTAGDPVYFWDWYPDVLIGARFKMHPMSPQFQDARVAVDNAAHPVAAGLPAEWKMNDEWYSFSSNPRMSGSRVIATLDEKTYSPVGAMGMDLRMGDHPIAWTHCIGKGRVFYSAIGHRPETYSHPNYVRMLENAVEWTTRSKTCTP